MKPAFLLGLALFIAGCSQNIQTSEAVRQGVMDHLKSRSDFGLNLDAMEIQVSSVQFRENEADATVAFVPKGQPAGSGMSMNYKMVREGDKWVVKDKGMAGGGLSSGAALPQGHAPVDGAAPAEPKGKN